MTLTYEQLCGMSQKYGASFYILDTEAFCRNFRDLEKAFTHYYPKTKIAYSYKTNYIPRLCSLVETMGGYGEVVSSMEYQIAHQLGISAAHIAFNGPCKDFATVELLLLGGGMVNLDSQRDLLMVEKIAQQHPHVTLSVGLRCNFDIGDGVISRFGFDTASEAFERAVDKLRILPNTRLSGLHCHFATRSLETWPRRVEKMLALVERLGLANSLDYLDLGGGLFGHMPPSLQAQFTSQIPSYEDYAEAVAKPISAYYADKESTPELLIEPGSALSGDVMYFAVPVENIKQVRGKKIATVLGSIYHINPTLNTKNPPIQVFSAGDAPEHTDLDFGGFTCIESDYLYRHYDGPLAEGDYIVFGNVGSYSVVLKPPFILPNFPVLELDNAGNISVIKQEEKFSDLFHTYQF